MWPTDGRSSTESRRSSKRKTCGDDDTTTDDTEHTPRERHKKRRDISQDSAVLSIAKPRSARQTLSPELGDGHLPIAKVVERSGTPISPRPRNAATPLFVTQEEMGGFAQSPLSQPHVPVDQLNDDLEFIGTLERNSHEQPYQVTESSQDTPIEDSRPPGLISTADPDGRATSLLHPMPSGKNTRPLAYSRPSKDHTNIPTAVRATSEDKLGPTRDAQPMLARESIQITHAQIMPTAAGAATSTPAWREVQATPTPPPAPAPVSTAIRTPTSESHTSLPLEAKAGSHPRSTFEPENNSKPISKIQVRYSIITSRIPRLVKHHWPIETLSSKSVQTVFDEVSRFTSKKNIQQIDFKLETDSQGESRCLVKRNDSHCYDGMMEDFSYEMINDINVSGNMTFRILLEPDPGKEGGVGVPESQAGFVVDNRRLVF